MEEPTTYIQYYQSPVGLIKISGGDKFISEVKFIDDQQDIPDTEPAPDVIRSCARQLTEYFNGSRRQFDIPINQEGSEFQQKVWDKLTDIPFGRTINYLDLAKRLGDPKKIRAAATTNGKNRIAVIIPCHRVIGSNGTLVGYAGGLWRKKWLLEHENKIANGLQTLF
ncbi:MAG TPA: methylated-DNA--[protein]-cysteine S-methyltransferase [Chitinophagaceae bacterium]|nr:methylated-DNA--[protein]-cysteine S-methyltransferase [Chitinophagaceae bacterium]